MKQTFKVKNAQGFTLAETMIVLVVLGVIAVVTVPALVNKHIESTNRTKIKKAMTVYDTALNKMVIENGIKDNKALYEDANSFAPENNCANTAPYFKVSTTLNNNPCTFKAPDGLYWDISKINAPILAFKEADLTDENSENRYQLVGHFDNTTGSLRVNDLQYETGYNKTTLTKTYNYINPSSLETEKQLSTADRVKEYLKTPCENPDTYESGLCANCRSCSTNNGDFVAYYDENGKRRFLAYSCTNGDNCGYIDEYDSEGNWVKSKRSCQENYTGCNSCEYASVTETMQSGSGYEFHPSIKCADGD